MREINYKTCQMLFILFLLNSINTNLYAASHQTIIISTANTSPVLSKPNLLRNQNEMPLSIYQKLTKLLGTKLYGHLLANNDFVKVQDIILNFLEKRSPSAQRRQRGKALTPNNPRPTPVIPRLTEGR